MFNIEEFRASTQRKGEGFAKPSRFTVILTIPPGLNSIDGTFIQNATRYIQFKINAVTWPNAALRPHGVRRYGYGPIEFKPWESLFNPIKLTVLCGGLGEEWSFFRRWVNLVVNFHRGYNVAAERGTHDDPIPVAGSYEQDAYEVAYNQDYATDIQIRTYREGPLWALSNTQDPANQDLEIMRVVLRRAYPLGIENIIYDWADTRKIQQFTVNLSFFDWYQEVLEPQKMLGMQVSQQASSVVGS